MKQPNGLCIGNIVFFFVFSPALARRRHLPKHKLCDLLSAYSAPDFNDGNMYLLGLLPHMQKFLSTLWILYFRIPNNTLCLLNPGGQILPNQPPPPPPLFPITLAGGYGPHLLGSNQDSCPGWLPPVPLRLVFPGRLISWSLSPRPKCSLPPKFCTYFLFGITA